MGMLGDMGMNGNEQSRSNIPAYRWEWKTSFNFISDFKFR